MTLVKTKSFQLATYSKGHSSSDKLALVLPGKLDTKDYAHMRSHVDYLADKGFFALSFDPPGTWESPGDIRLYTMTNYLKAVDELINYFGNKKTFIMGHSRGATISMLSSTNSSVIAYASIMSTFTKGGFQEKKDEAWEEKGYMISKRDLPPGGGLKEKQFKLPYSFFEDQTQYDITEELMRSTKPKLFVFGKHDALATPTIVKKTFNSFSDPKELYELNSDHDYRLSPKLIREVNGVLGLFLEKFNLYQTKKR